MAVGNRQHPRPRITDQYGRWVVLDMPNGPCRSTTKVLCRCACGQIVSVNYSNLVSGKSTQCKTCSLKQLRRLFTDYSFIPKSHRLRLYKRIYAAFYRCYNQSDKRYPRYGGRGISIFPAWYADRRLFAKYLMTLPGWDDPDLQLDRINNDGNYEPGNIRFVTPAMNCQNRRNSSCYK